jgi:hypothetical protein
MHWSRLNLTRKKPTLKTLNDTRVINWSYCNDETSRIELQQSRIYLFLSRAHFPEWMPTRVKSDSPRFNGWYFNYTAVFFIFFIVLFPSFKNKMTSSDELISEFVRFSLFRFSRAPVVNAQSNPSVTYQQLRKRLRTIMKTDFSSLSRLGHMNELARERKQSQPTMIISRSLYVWKIFTNSRIKKQTQKKSPFNWLIIETLT